MTPVSMTLSDPDWNFNVANFLKSNISQTLSSVSSVSSIYTVSQKNCATFIFTVTLANVGRFLKFFQCRNQKEMAHNKNDKFPTVA